MAREDMGTDIPQGFIARVAAGIRYAISGVGPNNWMGPEQPLAPLQQKATEGRRFDFPVGYNLQIQPRSDENIGFAQLRAFADGYDLLRLVIETRKDQIESFEWEIVPYKAEDDADSMKDDIYAVTEFFQSPDQENDWTQWLRMLLEELLVIDAIAIYPQVDRGNKLYGFELVDGATIKRLIDDTGRTPIAPSPAYQQVLHGVPANDLTREQLIYRMRNPRVSRIYGFSPVEQVMMTVNIAMRRQITQLDAYTKGNVPEMLLQCPPTWTQQQVQEFQTWWDSIMLGNMAAKRQAKFVPSLDGALFPKEHVLKDEMDEWLARIICFAFNITPSALIKQVNRASGEQMADTAKEEGLMPLLNFLSRMLTSMIRGPMGMPGLRFKFKVVNKTSPKEQAEIDKTYIDAKVKTPDEVREDLGLDALTPEQREAAFPQPPDPLEVIDATEQAKAKAAGLKPADADGKEPDGKTPAPAAPAAPSAAEKMLDNVINLLDPARMGDAFAKVQAAQKPAVVELQPHVTVDVGDTTVNVPPTKIPPAAPPAADPHLGKRLVARRYADGSLVAQWEDQPQAIAKGEQ